MILLKYCVTISLFIMVTFSGLEVLQESRCLSQKLTHSYILMTLDLNTEKSFKRKKNLICHWSDRLNIFSKTKLYRKDRFKYNLKLKRKLHLYTFKEGLGNVKQSKKTTKVRRR